MPLLPRRRNHDDAAFEAFVNQHGRRLFRTALLLGGGRAEAEDLYQETLERLAMRWSRVADPSRFCQRVIANLNIDGSRRRSRRPLTSELLDGVAPPDDGRNGADLLAVELRPVLLAALAGLAPQQRAVTVLRYFEDRSEAEVAEILGIAVGTVKSTASRAVSHLRSDPGIVALLSPTEPPQKGHS